MSRIILVLWIGTMLSFQVSALDYDEQLQKAMVEYIEEGNTSSAVRRLTAILEETPEHLEANWLLLLYTKLEFSNTKLESRIVRLREVAEAIQHIVGLAEAQKNSAFGHYVLSRYAQSHNAYGEAVSEIDKALILEPDSVRYLQAKGDILIDKGNWERNNELIYTGIDWLAKANESAGESRPAYFTEWGYHFDVAYAYGRLANGKSCPKEAIDNYLAVTEKSPYQNGLVAYSWNNISCAYRKIGQCEKAKEASENALKIRQFGAARTNLRYSEFCIQMQKLGIISE